MRSIFLDECFTCIQTNCDDDNLIIGGDFNSVVDQKDRISPISTKCKNTLKRFFDNLHVADIWRLLHPNDREYTFIDPSKRGNNSRIDKILISRTLREKKARHVI